MSDKILAYSILGSFIIHVAFIIAGPSFGFSKINLNMYRQMDIEYVRTEQNKSTALRKIRFENTQDNEKAQGMDKSLGAEPDEFAEEKKAEGFLKKILNVKKLLSSQDEKLDSQKQTAPVIIKGHKTDIIDPHIIQYQKYVIEKLQEKAFSYYKDYKKTGNVQIVFDVSKQGKISNVKIIPLYSSKSSYLRNISLKSLSEVNPLPKLPSSLKEDKIKLAFIIIYRAKKGVQSKTVR